MDVRPGPVQALAMRVGLSLGDQAAGLAAAIERGRTTLWQTRAAVWRGQLAYDRPAAWDAAQASAASGPASATRKARRPSRSWATMAPRPEMP